MAKPRTIVGIDPGTTAGVAVLSLHGELLAVKSQKNFSKDQIISFIIQHGKPLYIASDVAQTPSLLDEISRNLGAELFVPDNDLSTDYKDELAAEQSRDWDDHARDAVAAARNAFREQENTITRILERAAAAGVAEQGIVVEQVVKHGKSVRHAIETVSEPETEEEDVSQPEPAQEVDWQRVAAKRQRRIDRLETKVAHLEEVADAGDSTVEPVQLPRDEEVRARNRELKRLRAKLSRSEARNERLTDRVDRLEQAIEKLREGWVYVPKSVQGTDPVFLEDVTEVGDAGIVLTRGTDHRQIGGTHVIGIDDEEHVELSEAVIVPPALLRPKHDEMEDFMTWLDAYRNR